MNWQAGNGTLSTWRQFRQGKWAYFGLMLRGEVLLSVWGTRARTTGFDAVKLTYRKEVDSLKRDGWQLVSENPAAIKKHEERERSTPSHC